MWPIKKYDFSLQHENITKIVDIYDMETLRISNRRFFVFIEFMEGDDLLSLFVKQNRAPYSGKRLFYIISI